MPSLLGISAACATYIGGRFALHWQHKIHWLLGYGAGAVIGVAAFDLLPEARQLCNTHGGGTVFGIVLIGFLLGAVMFRFSPVHCHVEQGTLPADHVSGEAQDHVPAEAGQGSVGDKRHFARRNLVGAGGLALHSLLDGVGIGVALKVSVSVGVIVAIGVLVHDFSDGVNTVAIVLRNRGDDRSARKWLLIDSIAPLVGLLLTRFISLPATTLGCILALFCGLFLYIGGFDLLPEGYRRHTAMATTLLAALGAGTVLLAVTLAR